MTVVCCDNCEIIVELFFMDFISRLRHFAGGESAGGKAAGRKSGLSQKSCVLHSILTYALKIFEEREDRREDKHVERKEQRPETHDHGRTWRKNGQDEVYAIPNKNESCFPWSVALTTGFTYDKRRARRASWPREAIGEQRSRYHGERERNLPIR